nr:putative GH32 family protein [Cyphoderus albinus]
MKFEVFCCALLASWANCSPLLAKATNVQCTSESHRPRYHFSPREKWLNDPNGMVYYEGIYHLFFQYHPFSSEWGPMHWGHAISTDMIHWKELDIALYPDELGFIFSGSAVVDFKNTTGFQPSNSDVPPIVAVFTHAGGENNVIQRQSLAYSLDKAMTFAKYDGNPVLEVPTEPDFRDPKVHWNEEGQRWIMALAVRNRIEFYSSTDLKSWVKDSEFGANPQEGAHGGVWECPDVFPLKVTNSAGEEIELWALIVSINPGGPNRGSIAQYFIGNFKKNERDQMVFETFPWKDTQWLDWGPDNYAGVTFSNQPNNRFSYIGWMNNWIYANNLPTPDWRGQMTIPRELGLYVLNEGERQYRLTSNPIPEMVILRKLNELVENTHSFDLPPQTVVNLMENATFRTLLLELEITIEIENNPRVSICAFNEATREESCFGYNETKWVLDRSKSGNVGFHGEYAATLVGTAAREVQDQQTTINMVRV